MIFALTWEALCLLICASVAEGIRMLQGRAIKDSLSIGEVLGKFTTEPVFLVC